MEVNATVDIGNNLTSLLEKLAQQVGTTVDKIYPWYVQQAYLEGVTQLALLALLLGLSGLMFLYSFKKADFDGGNRYAVMAIIAATGLFFGVVGTVVEGPNSIRKIINPNYYAMGMLTRDIGKLTARQ